MTQIFSEFITISSRFFISIVTSEEFLSLETDLRSSQETVCSQAVGSSSTCAVRSSCSVDVEVWDVESVLQRHGDEFAPG